MSEPRATYRFGHAEARALLGGLRVGQLVPLASALGTAAALVSSTPARVSLPVAVVLVVGAAAFAFAPVGGATPQQWTPIVAGYALRGAAGARRSSSVPVRPHSRPPAAFAGVELVSLDEADERAPAALVDRRSASWTGVLAVRPENLALLSPDEREGVVQNWSRVLAACAAGTQLVRLQWIDRTLPDRADAIRAALAHLEDGDDADARALARRSYRALIERTARGAVRHECLLAVTVHGSRRVRGERGAPGSVALRRELEAIRARCAEAGLVVEPPLGREVLVGVLAESFAPLPGGRVQWPWPISVEERWSLLRADALVHTSYWISSWPQSEVRGDFLLPLLLTTERRTVSITVAPVPAQRAVHDAEQARTSNRADDALRASHGFALTARSRRDHDAVLQRERELAQGHVAYRFSGYITVSAPNEEELEGATHRIEQSGALARLELRRLYGRQLEGFCAALPLGRGCR